MAAQMLELTTSAAESVEPPWLSCHAHLRLVPGSSASLAPDSRSGAAVMWPQLLWLRTKQMLRWWISFLQLRQQCCTVAAAVMSHERFRTITITTAVLRRRPRDTRRAHLRLVSGSSASLARDSRSRAAVMWPQLLWLRTKKMLRWWMTVPLNSSSSLIVCHLDRLISWEKKKKMYKRKCTNLPCTVCFRSRRPYPPTSAFAVYKSVE